MATKARPNLLFITLDQWRGDGLQHLGHPFLRTPVLSALAARGVIPTERDWYLLGWQGDRAEWAPTDWRRDARLEAQFESAADPGRVEAVLLGALRRPSG